MCLDFVQETGDSPQKFIAPSVVEGKRNGYFSSDPVTINCANTVFGSPTAVAVHNYCHMIRNTSGRVICDFCHIPGGWILTQVEFFEQLRLDDLPSESRAYELPIRTGF